MDLLEQGVWTRWLISRGPCQPQRVCDSSDGRVLLTLRKTVNKEAVTSFSDLAEISVSKQQLILLLIVFAKLWCTFFSYHLKDWCSPPATGRYRPCCTNPLKRISHLRKKKPLPWDACEDFLALISWPLKLQVSAFSVVQSAKLPLVRVVNCVGKGKGVWGRTLTKSIPLFFANQVKLTILLKFTTRIQKMWETITNSQSMLLIICSVPVRKQR